MTEVTPEQFTHTDGSIWWRYIDAYGKSPEEAIHKFLNRSKEAESICLDVVRVGDAIINQEEKNSIKRVGMTESQFNLLHFELQDAIRASIKLGVWSIVSLAEVELIQDYVSAVRHTIKRDDGCEMFLHTGTCHLGTFRLLAPAEYDDEIDSETF